MYPLRYLEIRNFKCFGDKQRIELNHPTVLIGPNNCGKTTAIQALALWSHAVKTWHDAKGHAPPRKRPSTSINRLHFVAVPVGNTRWFWHNATVRHGRKDVHVVITVGVLHGRQVLPVTMQFRCHGHDLIYCAPDKSTLVNSSLIEEAARLNVHLLYPMSGLETEEPVLQPARIAVLLGQGQTAQVLRNLCLIVHRNNPDDWRRIVARMSQLFAVTLGEPKETNRGSINLLYRQKGVKDLLEIAAAGRGLQQLLLILAYLYSNPESVLLIDEPDAHLEILRQKQIYMIVKEIATENGSQVILVTHSETLIGEALEHNLTLLLDGETRDLSDADNAESDIRTALKYHGTDTYVRAKQTGHVLYVEGNTDIEMLRGFARRLNHGAEQLLDARINTYYVQNTAPKSDLDSQLSQVERSFGRTPDRHFYALRTMLPDLQGLAILDSDGRDKEDSETNGLLTTYWSRYETENYFVTPRLLRLFAHQALSHASLFGQFKHEIDETLRQAVRELVFGKIERDFEVWENADANTSEVLWHAQTKSIKVSHFAEEFFRRLAERTGYAMLLRKGDLHRLIEYVEPETIPREVRTKLDLIVARLS